MSSLRADWVIAIGAVALAVVSIIAVRWKSGRRRRFRVTIVIERDYEGPKEPES